jgi:hypothetical protein
MNNIDDGGPAFPGQVDHGAAGIESFVGMTLRQYAAIKLKVPDSGTDWLDEMITKSLRNDFAAKAMQGLLASGVEASMKELAEKAYAMADAMLKPRGNT